MSEGKGQGLSFPPPISLSPSEFGTDGEGGTVA